MGVMAPGWLAVPVVFILSLPAVRFGGGALQKIMPGDETTAVSSDSLLGRGRNGDGRAAREVCGFCPKSAACGI